MISRRSVIALSDVFSRHFTKYESNTRRRTADSVAVYDFLYRHEYDAWFCDAARSRTSTAPRTLKDFILKVHTGESLFEATPEWSWQQREKLGQELVRSLSEDVLNEAAKDTRPRARHLTTTLAHIVDDERLRENLELDGYVYKGERLLIPESDVLDVQQEEGILHSLYSELKLGEPEVALHHLRLSEEHYVNGKWDDSISNVRKFAEAALLHVALRLNDLGSAQIRSDARPVDVRTHLEREGLLSKKEREALQHVYGLLSETGSHPYIAANDQARLMRHLGLTFAQFVMLRLRGKLADANGV